jgi:hypothetical protein
VTSTTSGSTYTAGSNQTWLTPSPTSNATGGTTTITLSTNPGAAGSFGGKIRYTAPGFFGGSTAVTLNVAAPAGTLSGAKIIHASNGGGTRNAGEAARI